MTWCELLGWWFICSVPVLELIAVLLYVNYCWHNHTILNINKKGRCAKTEWEGQMPSPLSAIHLGFYFYGLYWGSQYSKRRKLITNEYYFICYLKPFYYKFNSNRNKVVLHFSYQALVPIPHSPSPFPNKVPFLSQRYWQWNSLGHLTPLDHFNFWPKGGFPRQKWKS